MGRQEHFPGGQIRRKQRAEVPSPIGHRCGHLDPARKALVGTSAACFWARFSRVRRLRGRRAKEHADETTTRRAAAQSVKEGKPGCHLDSFSFRFKSKNAVPSVTSIL